MDSDGAGNAAENNDGDADGVGACDGDGGGGVVYGDCGGCDCGGCDGGDDAVADGHGHDADEEDEADEDGAGAGAGSGGFLGFGTAAPLRALRNTTTSKQSLAPKRPCTFKPTTSTNQLCKLIGYVGGERGVFLQRCPATSPQPSGRLWGWPNF